MKEYTASQTFDYPWDYITAANWCKYPNEISTHVVAVDVLRREFNSINQTLVTERLITCKQPIPSWLKTFVGNADISYVREISTVDLINKKLIMRSVNLTLVNLLKVYETVIYEPLTINKTKFIQNAKFNSKMKFIGSKIENWGVDRFKSNASKGKLGFESILKLGMLNSLIDEFNLKSNDLLLEINKTTNNLLLEIDLNKSKILNEIKQCQVIKDFNYLSLDIIKEMSIKSSDILNDLNSHINNVIDDLSINNSNNNLLDKSNQILSEFQNCKFQISNHLNNQSISIINALNNKTLELLNNISNNSDINDNNTTNTNTNINKSVDSNNISFFSRLSNMFKKTTE